MSPLQKSLTFGGHYSLDGFFFAQIMEKDYQNEAVSDMIERHEGDYYERANQRLSPLLEY
ncbi:hypothetical protein MKX69_07835 [Enterococcus sp. FSL R5-0957]|uniref:hypothetical protein n=1 Tax=Enterococcus sp. FSL R5-0957 TaxID=2921725 RepID=UPI0030F62740